MKKILASVMLCCLGFCLTESSVAMNDKRQQRRNERAFQYAFDGDLSEIKRLIGSGTVNAGVRDRGGKTLLETNFSRMRKLEAGCDDDVSPTYYEMVVFLSEQGVSMYDTQGQLLTSFNEGTAMDICLKNSKVNPQRLHSIARKQGLDIFKDPCCNNGANLFLSAISFRRLDVVRYLLSQVVISGGKVSDLLNSKDNDGNGILRYAYLSGRDDIMEWALSQPGVSVDNTNGLGETQLLRALKDKDFEFARFLMDKGADVIIADKDNNTPLHAAAGAGNNEIVSLILSNPKVDVNAQNIFGNTPLHKACRVQNNGPVLKSLLKDSKRIDVNVPNKAKNTPLHIACSKNNLPATELLLGCSNIDVSLKNSDGLTSFFFVFDDYLETFATPWESKVVGKKLNFDLLKAFRNARKLPPRSEAEKFVADHSKSYQNAYRSDFYSLVKSMLSEYGILGMNLSHNAVEAQLNKYNIFDADLPSRDEFQNSYNESCENTLALLNERIQMLQTDINAKNVRIEKDFNFIEDTKQRNFMINKCIEEGEIRHFIIKRTKFEKAVEFIRSEGNLDQKFNERSRGILNFLYGEQQ